MRVRGGPRLESADGQLDQEQEVLDGLFLEAISRRYRGPLNSFFRRRIVSGVQDYEDLTQEVLLRLARRKQDSAIERIEGYIFRTAKAVLVDRSRGLAGRDLERSELNDDALHPLADFSPDRVLEGKIKVQKALAAIEALPPRARQALILFRFEDKRQAEIAGIMGISVSAVEKHIKLCMHRLHEAMREEI